MSEELEKAERKIASLERELRGVQEMLAFVLAEVGEPVVVTKEAMHTGLPEGAEIMVNDDQKGDCFVFSLVQNGQ